MDNKTNVSTPAKHGAPATTYNPATPPASQSPASPVQGAASMSDLVQRKQGEPARRMAELTQGASSAVSRSTAAEGQWMGDDRQSMSRDDMQSLCAANPAIASSLPLSAASASGCAKCGCVGLHACPGEPVSDWTDEKIAEFDRALVEYETEPSGEVKGAAVNPATVSAALQAYRDARERREHPFEAMQAALAAALAERAQAAQPVAGQAVPEGYKLPFRRETDKRGVVSVWDADDYGLPFELNTHTQRALNDKEGLAQELRDAEALADFMVAAMNAYAATPAPEQEAAQVGAVSDEDAYAQSGYRHFMSFEKFREFRAGVIPAAPVAQEAAQPQGDVMRRFGAPAGQQGAGVPMLTSEVIGKILLESNGHGRRDEAEFPYHFARKIEAEVASRFRAQGGRTSSESGNLGAANTNKGGEA